MPVSILLSLATALLAHGGLASRLKAYYDQNPPRFDRTFWPEAIVHLTSAEARAALREIQSDAELNARAEAGLRIVSGLLAPARTQFDLLPRPFETFKANLLAFLEPERLTPAKPDRSLAEANVAFSRGRELSYFLRGENRNEWHSFSLSVTQEMERQGLVSGEQIPAAVYRAWRNAADHEAFQLSIMIRLHLLDYFRDQFIVGPLNGTDRTDLTALFRESTERISTRLFGETRVGSGGPDLTLVGRDQIARGVYWRHDGRPFGLDDRRPFLLRSISPAHIRNVLSFELMMAHLRESDLILRWIRGLPEHITYPVMMGALANLRSEVLRYRETFLEILAIYRDIDGSESRHHELLKTLVSLDWEKLRGAEEYWPTRDAVTKHLPKFWIPSARGRDAFPPPPPIRNFDVTTAFRVFGSTSAPTDLWRWQHPLDRAGERWDPAHRTRGVATVAIKSDQGLEPRQGWLPVPTPFEHRLLDLRIRSGDGRILSETEYQLWRSQWSRSYAVRLVDGDARDLSLDATFVAEPQEKAPPLPRVVGRTWLDFALDLSVAGERSLSDRLFGTIELDGHQLSDMVRGETRYSFHPPNAVADGPGPFGSITPFLDAAGRVCGQCAHAAEHVLLPMLKTAYVDHPEYVFKASGFLIESEDRLIFPPHSGVEVFWRGRVAFYLNPSPNQLDPRAPTPEYLDRHLTDAQLSALRRKLVESIDPILERTSGVWPRGVSDESPVSRDLLEAPVYRLARIARKAGAGEDVSLAELARERRYFERWLETPDDANKRYRTIKSFVAATRTDAQFLAEQIHRVVTRTKCEEDLTR